MERTFGNISAEERRRAFEGERIDHHLTEYEASLIWSVENMDDFNKIATPFALESLYAWRDDNELKRFYNSIGIRFERIPADGVSCCRFVEDFDAYMEELKANSAEVQLSDNYLFV
jgi:hypothetical protein